MDNNEETLIAHNADQSIGAITLDGHYDITAIMLFCSIVAQLRGYEMYVDAFVINVFDTFSNPSINNILFDERYYSLSMVMLSFFTMKCMNVVLCTAYVMMMKSIYINIKLKMVLNIIRSAFVAIRMTMLLYILSSLVITGVLGLLMFTDSFIAVMMYFKDVTKYTDQTDEFEQIDMIHNRISYIDPMYHIVNVTNVIISYYESYVMKRLMNRTTTQIAHSIEDFCSICHNTRISGYIKINTCKHIYHDVCLNEWFNSIKMKRALSCPMCNQNV